MGQHLEQPGDMVELVDFYNLTHVPLHDGLYIGARPCTSTVRPCTVEHFRIAAG